MANEADFLEKVITLKGAEVTLSYVQFFSAYCVFFNKCLYFSYYMAGYFLECMNISIHSP